MHKISKIAMTLLAALSFISCSCSNEDLIQFNYISDPEYTPENIGDWKTYLYIFSGDKCINVKEYKNLSSCKYLDTTEGDRVSIIAMENEENIKMSSYNLFTVDLSATAPRIWTASAEIDAATTSISKILKPLTTDVSLSVTNAPESLQEVKVEFESFDNTWNILTDETSIEVKSTSTTLVSKGESKSLSLLPLNKEAGIWPPKITVSMKDEEIEAVMDMDWTPARGSKIQIEVDFANILSKGTFDVLFTYGDQMNPYSIKTISQSIETASASGFGQNKHYQVSVENKGKWNVQQVHDALCSNADKHGSIWNDWSNSRKLRDTMSYCLVETSFPAKIKVKKYGDKFSKVVVRPSVYNIDVVDCGDNMIEFTLPEEAKGKVSVEFDDDRQHNLFIYARTPDQNKPAENDPNVKYFGKGEHTPGTIRLTEGQTLYIDHGAKVYANVKTSGNNITIAGHGILSGEKMVHTGDNQYSWGDFLISTNTTNINAQNLTIKDITMIDSPGWNLIIPKTSGVLIDGINLISWELNGDGIDLVSSNNVEIKNCFIRTYDDCITLKCRFIVKPILDTYNINISNCLIWADYARGIVIGPEAGNTEYSGRIHDIDVKDCIFLQHKRGLNDDQRSAFAIGQGSDGSTDLWKGSNPPTRMSDITATNLIFDNIDKSGRNVSIWQYGGTPVLMENVTLKDFKVLDNLGNSYPALYIKTNGSSINNLKIENFTVNGEKVTDLGKHFSIDKVDHVSYSIK